MRAGDARAFVARQGLTELVSTIVADAPPLNERQRRMLDAIVMRADVRGVE